MPTLLPLAATVLAAAVALAPAAAQEPGSRATRDFVAAAAQSDAFEMLEADTALAQSDDPRVRGFAREMIADHGKLRGALGAAAARSGLRPPPDGVSSDQAPLLAALQSVRGPAFDRLYARQQALAHRSALVTLQGYAATGDDPAMRKAAAAAVPVVSRHLTAAERLSAASAAPGDSGRAR